MITYFIKSGICLALLLAFYHLILEREKMHQFNRFYLLGSVLFSFLAPLYKIYIEVTPQASELFVPMIVDSNTATEIVTSQTQEIDYMLYLAFAYTIIALILLVRFIKNLVSIYLKIKHHQKIKKEKATIILVDDAISPHTFWNYIFINKEEYNSNKIETELYTHELTHALQKHTFDVLLIEFLQVIFWINPTFIFLKKAIKLNHEFLADNKVITIHKNTTEYQYLLLNRAAWNNDYYLASNLNYLLTKKRLLMMTKQSSRTKILLKKLAVIPVLAGFTLLFAERVEAYESANNIEFLDAVIEKKTKENLFIASIERDDNHVHLKCYNCERWSGLEIPLNKEYTITDWGFSTDKHVEIAKYAFTIKATEKEVILKGIKNISWNSIIPPLNNKKYFFNQQGSLEYKKDNLEEVIKQYVKLEAPTLFIDQKTNNYYLNNRLINIDNIRSEFLKETKGEKSNLKIFTTGKVLMSLIKTIREKLSKKYLDEIVLTNSLSYLYEDGISIKTSKIEYDSIPALKRIVNRKNETFTYTTKDGREITKKISELTEEEKKILPPPPPPVKLKQKTLSNKLFQDFKNTKKYAIWIDGKAVNNNVLNSYKNTDFYNYTGSFVHKNARSKRFPQEYQYQLNTKEYIQKIKKQLPPPPSKNKKNVNSEKKLGWIVGNKAHEINILNKSNEKLNVFDIISHDKILNNYTIKRYFLNNKEVPEQHLKKIDYLNLETTRMKKISDEEINIYITTKN
ncbi:M56 family metallopeptidase [Tenacibaculum ascidiaceicola]|uniref:M56 family metallopeptidase n=1 Tax=Tenacibaculum ascidiaceicola TaxID=1699411 RepID=UPI00389460E0